MNGREVPGPRGRVLGGSGAINGMVYFRGHPRDYDDWANMGALASLQFRACPDFNGLDPEG